MMNADTHLSAILSEFLTYLADFHLSDRTDFPALSDLSKELGISVSSIREQLQVARSLGLVDVKPRTGIKLQPYSFTPAITQSLAFAVEIDRSLFDSYSDLRNHIEMSYWYMAVSRLTSDDIDYLNFLVTSANNKLFSNPIQLPHNEHREFHLKIYSRLENPFVTGILESFWQVYEAIGLSVYEDKNYLEKVWTYHQQMVEYIAAGDFAGGYNALITHMDLIHTRNNKPQISLFE